MWRVLLGAAAFLPLAIGNTNAATISILAEATIVADSQTAVPSQILTDVRKANHINQGFNREETRYSFEYDFLGISEVSSATLFLHADRGINFQGPYETKLKAYTGDGQITLGDFTPTLSTIASTFFLDTFTTVGFLEGDDQITIDVTGAINSLLLGGAQFVGFQLDMVDTNGGGFSLFAPELTIETGPVSTVPVPAAFPLLGLTLVGLGLLRWRQRTTTNTE